MAVNSSSTRLGCGRDIDEVWASIDRPPDAHEQTCVDCQGARASLSRLAAITTEQRLRDVADPELQPDPQVLVRIVDLARAEVRRGRRLPLDEPTRRQLVSNLTVSEQAVAAVVRHAGDTTAGVQVRRVAITLVDDPEPGSGSRPEAAEPGTPDVDRTGPEPEPLPARVAVSLQISVSAFVSIPMLTQDLRRAVMAAVDDEVGMNAIMIDITVTDVHDD